MENIAGVQNQYNDVMHDVQNIGNHATAIGDSFLGDLLGFSDIKDRQVNAKLALANNLFNSAEAAKDRNWQEMMSNTQYSRAAKDLQSLGFSPMALFSSANSASVPSGAVAHSSGGTGFKTNNSSALLGSLLGIMATIATNTANMKNQKEIANINANAKVKAAESAANSKIEAAKIYKGPALTPHGSPAGSSYKPQKFTAKDEKEWQSLMKFFK